MWHVTHSAGWSFSQNVSFLAAPVWDWQCLEDIQTKESVIESNNQSINEWMNDGGDCRKASATPGLLIT